MTLAVVFVAAIYFAPTLIAFAREAPSPYVVLVINLFTGWTMIGWIVAMILAVRDRPQSYVQVINTYAPPPAVPPPAWHDPLALGKADPPGRPDDMPPTLPPFGPR